MTQIEVTSPSPAGYPAVPRVTTGEGGAFGAHAHSVQFYEESAFLLDGLSRFIGAALGAGDAAIVIATPAHREGLAQRLAAVGLDTASAVAQGRYVVLDAAEMLSRFRRDGQLDAARFADLLGQVIRQATATATSAPPRVAAFGEMVALLWAEGQPEAAIQLEQLWNDLAQTHTFDLHCAYPLHFFSRTDDAGLMEQICATHTRVIPAESYTALGDEAARLRAITRLQQKAQALETEIAQRQNAEQALRERNQELQEAIAARDEFLSIAAHELKTPVTSLRGFAQLLLRDMQRQRTIAPERLTVALQVLDGQTGKLSELVARLLDTGQIEAGKLRIEPIPVDLVALVQAALAQQRGKASHTFVLDAPDQLEAEVDPVRFEQVITNLLDNAVKYSPQGGQVLVELTYRADGRIQLAITDEGVGIPPDQWVSIFDRFHQAHGAQHLSGLGLGLYITRQIVELHGGSVQIEAPAHRGARFVVTLPPAPRGAPTPSGSQVMPR